MVEHLALVESHMLGLKSVGWLLIFFIIVKTYKIEIIWVSIRLPYQYQIFFEVLVSFSIFFE
jgi:hypothetical protein